MHDYRVRSHVTVIAPALLALLSVIASGHESPGSSAKRTGIPREAQSAVTVVDEFTRALQRGDLLRLASLLDPSVLVLESGSAELSREEYLGHHAKEDVAFLANAQVELKRRRASAVGDLTWVASESLIRFQRNGEPQVLFSTETMVLRRVDREWRIVHIHWSSRLRTK